MNGANDEIRIVEVWPESRVGLAITIVGHGT
jgi:hypothetical protein